MKRVLVLMITSAFMAGCSDPKDANEDNFAEAINAYYESNPSCVTSSRAFEVLPEGKEEYQAFPAYVRKTEAQGRISRDLMEFDALHEAGLLTKESSEIKQRLGPTDVFVYDLTEEGRENLEDVPEDKQQPRSFCYGVSVVKEVTEFTEPSDIMGMTVSEVKFLRQIENPAKWADNPQLQKAFPDMVEGLTEPSEEKATLVLTNKGWRHSKM